jgi:hypothetical protein
MATWQFEVLEIAQDGNVFTPTGWQGLETYIDAQGVSGWEFLGIITDRLPNQVVLGLPSGGTDVADVSRAGAAGNVHEPAANTAAVVTLVAGGAGVSNVVGMVGWSYDGIPAGGSLTIENGAGTTIFKVDITTTGSGFLPFSPPIRGSVNTAMVLTLAAGGGGISGIVSVHAWTE